MVADSVRISDAQRGCPGVKEKLIALAATAAGMGHRRPRPVRL